MWLLYSGNFLLDQDQKPHPVNPPGGHYGMTFQKIEFIQPGLGPVFAPEERRPMVADHNPVDMALAQRHLVRAPF